MPSVSIGAREKNKSHYGIGFIEFLNGRGYSNTEEEAR
jgi:hypothetical protein